MKAVRSLVAMLVATLLVSACAGHKTRPRGPHASAGATSGAVVDGKGGVNDNIRLSQDKRYRRKHDGGPGRPEVDISALPEPVPKVEPRSRYGNKSPYEVRGHTYYVLPTADGYNKRGIASWYGNKFDGYLTSSMERYDMYKFTAASKVLPLPSYARVTNLANGKSVIVRVNDRGPFVPGRIIDLSYAAAVRIGIWPRGTGKVQVQAIDPAHPGELSKPAIVSGQGAKHGIWLQVGAFSSRSNARRLAGRLRRAHLAPVHMSQVTLHGRQFTRVRLGPLSNASAADRISAQVQRLGLPAPKVAVD